MAIGETIVGKDDVGPDVDAIVAIGALTDVMAWRHIGSVARLAIGEAIVGKGDVGPDVGAIVAIGALTVVMI